MNQEIKLVIVDLDGTLLNSNHQLSERTEKVLRAALDQGIQVMLATGKTYYSARHIIEKLKLVTPGVYVQGLIVHNADGNIRHQQTLDPALARRVITFAEDRGFTVLIYSGTRLLMRAKTPLYEHIQRYDEPAPEIVGPLQNILDTTPLHKLLLYGDEKRVTALRWQLSMQLNGQATLVYAQIPGMMEVLPHGASKGRAVKALIRELGFHPNQVLAIGDGENDIEMIQVAGIGVAMGNADERLKKVADHIVADNDNDGVAEALEKFIPSLAPQPIAVTNEETPSTEVKE